MGTVMASKNIKAIAVRGTGAIEVAEPDKFKKLVLQLEDEIQYCHKRWEDNN